MSLKEDELLRSYGLLHRVFPEDLHIARPLIQMVQQQERWPLARELAMAMARRMLATGQASHAIGFLALCKQLNHPDTTEIESLTNMARFTLSAYPDTDNSECRVFALIEQLSDSEALDFIKQGNLKRKAAGCNVVKQGDSSKTFYLILEGQVDVQIELEGGQSQSVKVLKPGDFFGEFACIYNLRRSASVVTLESTLLLEFSDQALSMLIQHFPIAGDYMLRTVQTRMVHAMTYSMPAFAKLPEQDKLWAAEESVVDEYRPGEAIKVSSESPKTCQIILSGAVECSSSEGNQLLTSGAMFGNASPFIQLPGDAELKVREHLLLCKLPEGIFHSFMNAYGSFEQQIKQLSSTRPY
ncbi:cAMP-dependent protein kinase regulator [Mariprofundus micogutta]|uniref:cAMP-dependent protein kinase regulator n=1 Tax=Mariprofundus micogutta TaxID=1921010 RepID=A0A1L8CQJ4_9PROT|nr:cyclic nucleotide-binding domain-containing protein [Mariprofundus micogutta]GAV21167.1 cAMP-dependent protein kinase regulator [Mariprofundus micogutta]